MTETPSAPTPIVSINRPPVVQEVLKTIVFDDVTQDNLNFIPVLAVPENVELQGVAQIIKDHERTLNAPYRRRGVYEAADVASLLNWMDEHTDAVAPVFAKGVEKATAWKKPEFSLIGIGNYSAGSDPGWHDWRVEYKFPVSEEWGIWATVHGAWMSQSNFAEFIEARIYDLTSLRSGEELSEAVTRFLEATASLSGDAATPNRVVELSRGLQVAAESKLETSIKLQSGEATLSFSEDHKDAGGRPLRVPPLFYIRIPVFYQTAPVLVGVRLRYRREGTSLVWQVLLFAPELIVRAEFDKLAQNVIAMKRTLYLGSPDMPTPL